MKENQSPHCLRLRNSELHRKDLSLNCTTPRSDPGHPKPPGLVIYHLFKLQVDSLDPYREHSVLLCIGLSYLAWVLVFYTILTLGSLLWPRLLTLTTQYHLGSISRVWVLYLTLILNRI